MLDIQGYEGENVKLLLFLIVVTQLSDVLQYVFGKLFGKHPIVPKLSPNKTIEGFVGGILSSVLIGICLYWVTPFSWWAAGLMSLAITLMGFVGGLCMSAIKRDSGIKDFWRHNRRARRDARSYRLFMLCRANLLPSNTLFLYLILGLCLMTPSIGL
ncbi:Phosphatidate cytidylyltransferase [Providencia stuartii]|nr:Phosphatidate cytidylyltransferase [Providencia stuartii]